MLQTNARRMITVASLTALCVPLMLGQVCIPPTTTPPGSTTLSSTTTSVAPATTFTPTVVGRVITVQVSGNVTGSRIQVQVWDPNGNMVVNVDNPTSNTSIGTFTSQSTGSHWMVATELGTAATSYTTLITQSG